MFVTLDDFDIMPYNIPAQALTGMSEEYIEEIEERYLRKVLGNELYAAFIAGLEEDPIDQKWSDLRDGAQYGDSEKWVGMRQALIPLVYSYWLTDTFDNNSNIGVVVANAENSTVINPSHRIAKAYNSFARNIGDVCLNNNTLYGFLLFNMQDYTGWKFESVGFKNALDL
jgi:hypothetical protein